MIIFCMVAIVRLRSNPSLYKEYIVAGRTFALLANWYGFSFRWSKYSLSLMVSILKNYSVYVKKNRWQDIPKMYNKHMNSKKCDSCKEIKPLNLFFPINEKKTSSKCISCGGGEWRDDISERRVISGLLKKALKLKIIDKPDSCSMCGQHHKRIIGHHPILNIENALSVQWVCPGCHGKIHASNLSVWDNLFMPSFLKIY